MVDDHFAKIKYSFYMVFRTSIYLCFVLLAACNSITPKVDSSQSPSVEYIENPSGAEQFTFKSDILLKVSPNPNAGFNFSYYLYLPEGVQKESHPILLVESNNTGLSGDDISIHDQAARKVAERGYFHRISKKLKFPMLVPVFPRPSQPYTHYLNRKTMGIRIGQLKRIDLQLIAMIEDAQTRLAQTGITVKPKIFMNGYSSSAGFALRFTALHPEFVQGVTAGGINALPILPLKKWQNQILKYPIGIGDVKQLTGKDFDSKIYLQIPQKLYMGELDTNDTVPFRDSWDKKEADFIGRYFGEKMMPDRWEKIQKILKAAAPNVELATYPGVGHKVTPEIEEDIFQFFSTHR